AHVFSSLSSLFCIFFFQAEDGIRDFHVTGVQTCALPISPACATLTAMPAITAATSAGHHTRTISSALDATAGRRIADSPPVASSSEERRVGKAGSARCSPSDDDYVDLLARLYLGDRTRES